MINSASVMKNRRLPLVTGVSPKEGPPGTRIIIRGENLGIDPRDLIGLKICGMDCLLSAEWKSPSKIIARTGPGKGKGDIIVITKSAGNGSCTVGFRGYFLQTGPLQESAVWIDESQTVRTLRDGQASTQMPDREDEDPLGISSEGDKPKISEEEMLEMFPEGCGNLSLENFSAVWYLLENHQSANFEDLKAGLNYMQRKANQRSEEPIAIIRSNLTTILECLDRLKAMYEKFTKDDIRGDCMNSYAVLLMQAKSCADGLFQEVLGRKDRADSTRNALSVLTKFRFLFYLPLNIEKNIQKGNYNIVINDYEKAKSLFADTQVKVFRKVFNEVEAQIANFKQMLHLKLLDPSIELEEQKRLIRYLISLEYQGDPAWECLVNQQKWLLSLLTECKEDHIDLERCAIQQGDAVTPGRWKIANVSGLKPGVKYRIPQKVMYVEDLTEIMMDNFPDLWKLGQAYFTGEFINKLEISDKGFKIDTSKHSKLKQMISELVSLFTNLIRAAFLPESLETIPDIERQKYGIWPGKKKDVPGAWLPHCVRHIRMCASSMSRLDPSGSSMILLQELAFDLRTNCMFTLLKQAIVDAKSLHTKETWMVETDDENGGTTQLPALFENIVSETIQHLHEVVVLNKAGEPEIFSQRPIQKEATMLCTQLLQSFSTCMEQLAFNPPLPKMESSHKIFGRSSEEELFEDPIPSLDKRLVIMLSNCSHTIEKVIPRMIENLNKHGYVEMQKSSKTVEVTYRDLDNKLFDAYIEQKSDPIVGCIETNMYRGGFDWKKSKQPTDVRSYLKEMLMGMIEVHAEVFSIFPKFVSRVMGRVIEAVCDEMTRLIQCSDGFNNNGAIQAHLDLCALQDAVTLYKTNATSTCFEDAFKHIPNLSSNDQQVGNELLSKFKSRMRFQLMCFQPDVKGSLIKSRAD
ncbi:exocyst complex component 2-like isoform X2 [Gigantopelta aegis]|uniref:exocyst complex component 2-like isoform X2 n=1 Tax=Gigantopelta aegis TaxID=1735272 RepID=UPI001B889C3B|nr:exocyst complex component 2-like isoform X2 [Gigantopelta aegis]